MEDIPETTTTVASDNHGWQKVTNVKKQRRQEHKDTQKPIASGKGASTKGSTLFSSLEDQSKERRARIEASAAATAAAEREAERAQYDADDDDDDSEREEGAPPPAAAEPKKPKKPKKPKVSVAEAAAAIKLDEMAAFLAEISESFAAMPDIQLMRCTDFFARAFSAVLPSQLNIPKMIKDSSLVKVLDVPLSDVPDEIRTTASDWLAERPADHLSKFLVTLIRAALEDVLPPGKVARGTAAKPLTPPKAKVGMLVVLTLVLRRRPDVMLLVAETVRSDAACAGQERLPMLAWMYGQVALSDLVSGMALFVQNLLPLTFGKQGSPVGRDVALTYFQTVLLRLNERKARAVLLNGAFRKGERLVPPAALDQMMRLAHPTNALRTKATERFTALFPLVKEISLAGSGRTKSTKAVATALVPLMFRAAGEDPEPLSQEACSVFVWCLSENPDCYLQWERHHSDDHAMSSRLLTHILRNWPIVKSQLAPPEHLRKFLASIRKKHVTLLEELDGAQIQRKKDVQEADAAARKLQGKVSSPLPSCLTLSALLVAAVAAAAGGAVAFNPTLADQLRQLAKELDVERLVTMAKELLASSNSNS